MESDSGHAMEAARVAAKRRTGMSPEALRKQRETAESWDDWRTQCPHCGAKVTGTHALIREHVQGCEK